MQIRTIIAAVAQNRAIGLNNELPWNLDADWEHFKEITKGHSFIMGRKSYEAEDHLLSDKWNYILTRQSELDLLEKSSIVSSFETFVEHTQNEPEVFILGGASVFKSVLQNDLANKMVLTCVHAEPQGDAFFPEVNWDEWTLKSSEFFGKNEFNDHDFDIKTYVRK